jgi:hypothetical protein
MREKRDFLKIANDPSIWVQLFEMGGLDQLAVK